MYDQFVWEGDENKDNPTHVLLKIESYCNPRKNEVAESHKLWSVKYNSTEPFDNFLTVGWLVVLRIYVALAVFQPYRDLEAGDNQSLKIHT